MLYQKQYLHLHTFCFYKKHYKKSITKIATIHESYTLFQIYSSHSLCVPFLKFL